MFQAALGISGILVQDIEEFRSFQQATGNCQLLGLSRCMWELLGDCSSVWYDVRCSRRV
jgi:hypothetical protein